MNPDKSEKLDPAETQDDRIFDETIFKEHLRNKLTLLIDSVFSFKNFKINQIYFNSDPRKEDPSFRFSSHRSIEPLNRAFLTKGTWNS